MGQTVSDLLENLVDQGVLTASRCLLGFPHPSGANGHRKRQFAERREMLKRKANEWFCSIQ